jgi:hypothetical protein
VQPSKGQRGKQAEGSKPTAADASQEVIRRLDKYGLSREDLFETLQELQLGPDGFAKVILLFLVFYDVHTDHCF